MTVRNWIAVALAGVVLTVLSVPMLAHHSIGSFWNEQANISISGTVKQLRIMNPHSEILIDVREPNGQTSTWLALGSSASGMASAGWTGNFVNVGARVTVEGAPPRKEGAKGILIKQITTADGKVFKLRQVD